MMRSIKLAVACVAVVVASAGQVQAGIITFEASDVGLNVLTKNSGGVTAVFSNPSPSNFSIATGLPTTPLNFGRILALIPITFDLTFNENVTLESFVFNSSQQLSNTFNISGLGVNESNISAAPGTTTVSIDLLANQDYSFSYNTIGTGFSFSRFDSITFSPSIPAVPEPSSIVLLSIGAIGLFGYGYRRKQKQAA